MQTVNLNDIQLEDRDEIGYLRHQTAVSVNGDTQVYFDNLESHLIRHLSEAQVAIGCVAWLTNERILNAMANLFHTSIVVQKEDFLRPDMGATNRGWETHLRHLYDALQAPLDRYTFHSSILSKLNYCGDVGMDPVRCVGNYNANRRSAFPRSHHKFIVLGNIGDKVTKRITGDMWGFESEEYYIPPYFVPYAVWTGSFNFTENAVYSFENAVYMTDPQIVAAYVREFAHIYALSEPLDWQSEWVAPEFRIGS